MLRARWKQILFGALFQYVHAMSTQLAHRMHQPQEQPLGDIGFKYLPVSNWQLGAPAAAVLHPATPPARRRGAGVPPEAALTLCRRRPAPCRSWACKTRG